MADNLLDGNVMKGEAEGTQNSQSQGIEIKEVVEMPSNEPEATVPTGLTLAPAASSQELAETNLNPPEKLKASNFPALSLQIGPWKIVSADSCIVVKFYYGKRRIVWEMILDGMKRKMDIKWARVSAIHAIYTQGRSDTLEIELEKPPKFYFESNVPRGRTTKWTRGVDFTSSYAEIYKRHTVEFKEGTLESHYVKLLHANGRLNELSQRPFPAPDSSIFFHWVPLKKRLLLTERALHRTSVNAFAVHQHLAQQAPAQVRAVEAPAQDVVSGRWTDASDDFVSSPQLVPLQTAPVIILPPIRSAAQDDPFRLTNMGIDMTLPRQANDCKIGSVPVPDAGSAFRPYTNVGGQEHESGDPNLLAGPGLRNADVSVAAPPENEGSGAIPQMLLPPKKRRLYY